VDNFKRESLESPKPVSRGLEFNRGFITQMSNLINIIESVVLEAEENIC